MERKRKITKENIWEFYPKSYSVITPSIQKILLKESASFAKGKVLDAGTGVGKLIPYLLRNHNVRSIIGIDYEKAMLEEAKRRKDIRIETKKLQLLQGNVMDLKFENSSFDTITSLNVLYTLTEPLKFLEESFRVLRKGGNLVLSSPNQFLPEKIGELERVISEEFEGDQQYKIFKKCNEYLVSGFKPKLFSIEEICNLLNRVGFEIQDINNKYYLGANYRVIAKKVN